VIEGSAPGFKIGPIISYAFFRSAGGELDYPSTDLHSPGLPSFAALHALRGPFPHTGEFLAPEIRANLLKYEAFPQETLEAVDAAFPKSDAAEAGLSGDQQDGQGEDLLTNNYRVSRQKNNSQESRREAPGKKDHEEGYQIVRHISWRRASLGRRRLYP
jgi:hypothetical protein